MTCPGFMALRATPTASTVARTTQVRGLHLDRIARAAAHGVSARSALDRRDSYGFFRAAESLIVTGPTRTNVNDYRVILIQ